MLQEAATAAAALRSRLQAAVQALEGEHKQLTTQRERSSQKPPGRQEPLEVRVPASCALEMTARTIMQLLKSQDTC